MIGRPAQAWRRFATGALVATVSRPAFAQVPQPVPAIERGTLPNDWAVGESGCVGAMEVRVQDYNENFVILRQSGCTNFEKPFLYLIFGEQKALLVDTGAPGANVGNAVKEVMHRWSTRHEGRTLPLVVVHSHGHGDHTAGDGQLLGTDVTVVPATLERIQQFFGIGRWPGEVATYDLGGRIIDVIPIPGHQVASVAYYDRRTGILLTGDTMYPGRLYIRDAAAFIQSVRRLVDFTSTRIITHVLGAHIENSRTPYVDYAEGTKYQPAEHPLELGRAHLLELQDGLAQMGARVERRVLRDFTIWPIQP